MVIENAMVAKWVRLTNERNTWRVYGGHDLPVLVEVLVGVYRHLARSKLLHEALVDLLPCALEPPNGWRVQPGDYGDHGREVVH